MCGIAGIIAPYKDRADRTHIARVLLHDIDIRGGDSCGIYANGRIIKETVRAHKFPLPRVYGSCILHTRLATHGSVTRKNAHPYRRGRTVGVHNGICVNYDELMPTAAVDSVAVIDMIDKYGVRNAYKKMRGTFATATVSRGVTTLARAGNPCFVYRVGNFHVFSSHQIGLWLNLISDDVERVPLDDDHMLEFADGKPLGPQKEIETAPYNSGSIQIWKNGAFHNYGSVYVPAKKVTSDCAICGVDAPYDSGLECNICNSCYLGLKVAGNVSDDDDDSEYFDWTCDDFARAAYGEG